MSVCLSVCLCVCVCPRWIVEKRLIGRSADSRIRQVDANGDRPRRRSNLGGGGERGASHHSIEEFVAWLCNRSSCRLGWWGESVDALVIWCVRWVHIPKGKGIEVWVEVGWGFSSILCVRSGDAALPKSLCGISCYNVEHKLFDVVYWRSLRCNVQSRWRCIQQYHWYSCHQNVAGRHWPALLQQLQPHHVRIIVVYNT